MFHLTISMVQPFLSVVHSSQAAKEILSLYETPMFIIQMQKTIRCYCDVAESILHFLTMFLCD
jgi:hypothetical protein